MLGLRFAEANPPFGIGHDIVLFDDSYGALRFLDQHVRHVVNMVGYPTLVNPRVLRAAWKPFGIPSFRNLGMKRRIDV